MIATWLLLLILAGLAGLHVYWASGGKWRSQDAVPMREGKPLLEPGPGACLVVALLLAAAAVLVAWRGGILDPGLYDLIPRLGIWGIAAVFGLRAFGDFRYVGFFKTVTGSEFARLDSKLYSPLCLFICILAMVVARS